MDPQLQELLAEVSSALADMVTAMNEKTQSSDQISSALADMAEALDGKSQGKSLESIAKAISALRPQIVVQPAPVVVQMVGADCTYEVSMKYDNFDRITSCMITKGVKQ